MGTVRVVTDGTSSITPEMGAEHGVHVVPLYVMFGEETYVDGVNLSSAEFYRLLKSHAQLPTTSQPTAEDFVKAYTEVWESMPAGEDNAIVSVHASVKMSATVNSARAAAKRLPEMQIHIIDSQSISMGLGLMALAAARAAQEGQSAAEIVQLVEKLIQNMKVVFTVETLENLHKGGRIGGATALIGSLLNIKPILCIDDGQVEALEKQRSRTRAIRRLLELVAEGVGSSTCVHAAVLHCNAPDAAQEVVEQVADQFKCVELFAAETGPTIGTHGGPGTVGVAYYIE
jgi:DegV family protein with EDD domain